MPGKWGGLDLSRIVTASPVEVSKAIDRFGKPKRSEIRDMQVRHTAWIKKRINIGGKDGWRPQKRHRTGALKWCMELDNMLKTATAVNGLLHFKRDAESELWKPFAWCDWPLLTVVNDQGPDCTCGYFALAYEKELCVDVLFDVHHAVQNDLECGLKAAKAWAFALLLLVPLNLGQGPQHDECLRFHQLHELMTWYFKNNRPEEATLFKAFAAEMLREHADSLNPDEDPHVALWSHLQSKEQFCKQGARVKLCKFMGWYRGVRQLLREWHTLRFRCECLCLEFDFLQGGDLKKKLLVPSSALSHAAELKTTSSRAVQVDAKLLKGVAYNACVITALAMGSGEHRRLAAILIWIAEPLSRWQGHAQQTLKSVSQSETWLCEQSRGGFMELCWDLFETLESQEVLDKTGFFDDFSLGSEEESLGQSVIDDELAETAGVYCLALVGARLKRCSYLILGYPWRLLALNRSMLEATAALHWFKRHLSTFEELKEIRDGGK
eukprot:6490376-Amphidinium_carterae.1